MQIKHARTVLIGTALCVFASGIINEIKTEGVGVYQYFRPKIEVSRRIHEQSNYRDYIKYADGSEKIIVYHGSPDDWRCYTYYNKDGDDLVDKVRIHGITVGFKHIKNTVNGNRDYGKYLPSQIKKIFDKLTYGYKHTKHMLIRDKDYEEYKKTFDEADKILLEDRVRAIKEAS